MYGYNGKSVGYFPSFCKFYFCAKWLVYACMVTFVGEKWFGGLHVLFVGDILQLPPVNAGAIFDTTTSNVVSLKLGCMTSINLWKETVVYDELTSMNDKRETKPLYHF